MSLYLYCSDATRPFVIKKLKEKLLVSRSEPTYKIISFFCFYSLNFPIYCYLSFSVVHILSKLGTHLAEGKEMCC